MAEMLEVVIAAAALRQAEAWLEVGVTGAFTVALTSTLEMIARSLRK